MPTDPADAATAPATAPATVLRAVAADDLAVHHEVVDPGPDHTTRAVIGFLLGAAVGVAGALFTSRRED